MSPLLKVFNLQTSYRLPVKRKLERRGVGHLVSFKQFRRKYFPSKFKKNMSIAGEISLGKGGSECGTECAWLSVFSVNLSPIE